MTQPAVELSAAGSTRRIHPAVLAAVIVVVTVIAYLPSMRGGFIWDDNDYVTDNTNLRSAEGLVRLWEPGNTRQYYPIVFTSFWVEYHLWELNPLGYHITNVIGHIVSALLIWRLFSVLGVRGAPSRRRGLEGKPRGNRGSERGRRSRSFRHCRGRR